MLKLFKIELKKLFTSTRLYIALIIGICISLIQVIQNKMYVDWVINNDRYPIHPRGLYNVLIGSWIGGSGITVAGTIFFHVIPLLAAIAYGVSYYNENKNGYAMQMIIRQGRKKYLIVKGCVTFLSGMITIAVPLIINLMLNAMFCPMAKDNILYMQSGVYQEYFFSKLYYQKPMIYLILAVLLISIWGGVWALMAFTYAMFMKNAVLVVIAPVITAFLMSYIAVHIKRLLHFKYYEVTPLYLMYPAPDNANPVWLEAGYMLVMIGIMIFICYRSGVARENI